MQHKLSRLFLVQKHVLYNILKVLRNPLGGKFKKIWIFFWFPLKSPVPEIKVCLIGSIQINFILPDSCSVSNFQSFDGYIDHIWRKFFLYFPSNARNVTTFLSPNLAGTISSDPLFFSARSTEFEFANINTLNVNSAK